MEQRSDTTPAFSWLKARNPDERCVVRLVQEGLGGDAVPSEVTVVMARMVLDQKAGDGLVESLPDRTDLTCLKQGCNGLVRLIVSEDRMMAVNCAFPGEQLPVLPGIGTEVPPV